MSKWRVPESVNPILSYMCSNLRGETCQAEVSSPPGMWTNATNTKKTFCIEHTTQKPLRLSAPTSEPFITSPHPFYRYNFHLLNGPLLVSLPSAQRHRHPLSDTNPVYVAKTGEKTGVKIVISSLNFGNYTLGSELMSRDKWSRQCMNSYVTKLSVQVRPRKWLKLHIVQCVHTHIDTHAFMKNNPVHYQKGKYIQKGHSRQSACISGILFSYTSILNTKAFVQAIRVQCQNNTVSSWNSLTKNVDRLSAKHPTTK